MKRLHFLSTLATMTLLQPWQYLNALPDGAVAMPALFVGHGSPMNAIEENRFSKRWFELGIQLPKPSAILCISAHWETRGIQLTASPQPETIHDFYGFPEALHQAQYPAPGAPDWVEKLLKESWSVPASADPNRGLDHGTWSVLMPMYPKADVPVFQLSLNTNFTPEQHYALGASLAGLRKKGVLIIGSGNLVHNLGMLKWQEAGYDWAIQVNNSMKTAIQEQRHADMIQYRNLSTEILKAIPTEEHYLPALYVLGMREKAESLAFFNDETIMGSISMTSFIIGA